MGDSQKEHCRKQDGAAVRAALSQEQLGKRGGRCQRVYLAGLALRNDVAQFLPENVCRLHDLGLAERGEQDLSHSLSNGPPPSRGSAHLQEA